VKGRVQAYERLDGPAGSLVDEQLQAFLAGSHSPSRSPQA
jgi:hypothetical protein